MVWSVSLTLGAKTWAFGAAGSGGHMTQTKTDPSRPGPLQSAVFGAVLAVDASGHCLALATIFFAGALSYGLGLATGIFLFATLVSTVSLYLFSQFRTALGIAQDTSVAILAPAATAAALGAAGGPEAQVATAFGAIGAAAVASGVVFWLAGHFRLGRVLRMFPYSVAAGFLASSGFLLVWAAVQILTGAEAYAEVAAALTEPAVLAGVVAALAMALALLVVVRRPNGTLWVVVVILLFLAGYHGYAAMVGLGRDEAVALGLLPETGAETGLVPGLWLFDRIDWARIAAIWPTIAAVVLINLIALLLNMSGVELAARRDVDENRELRRSGLTNLLVGAFGSTAAFLQGGSTIIATRLGVHRGGFVAGHLVVMALACFVAAQIVALVPTFVAAGLLMFIGLAMLEDWLIATRRRMVVQDWLIVAGIVVLTASVGILPAVAVGLGLAILTFVAGFVRLRVIRSAGTGATRRSILDRTGDEYETLARLGDSIRTLHLQGPLFFGSVEQLMSGLRDLGPGSVESGPTPALILDFAAVSTFDSSACAAMQKLGNRAEEAGMSVHLSGLPLPLETMFRRWGLGLSGNPFHLWDSFDAALEQCETALLAGQPMRPVSSDPVALLRALGKDHPRTADLLALMAQRRLQPGDVLIKAEDQSRDLYILLSGRLGVFLTNATGPKVAVRSMGPGAIVGEVARLLDQPRTADVICQEEALILCLSEAEMDRIERDLPEMAALLTTILARSLARKVMLTNALLSGRQPRF